MPKSKKNVYNLIDVARDGLKQFDVTPFFAKLYGDDDFYTINAHIVDKTLCENKNIYISTSGKDSTQQLTLPILYPVACRLLLDNAPLYHPTLERVKKSYIFVANGICRTYRLKDGKHSLVSKIKGGYKFRHFINPEDIFSAYYVVESRFYSENKCHKTLDDYKSFLISLCGSDTMPISLFVKKMVVVCQRNELFRQLRELSLSHCLPIACITKNHSELTDETLPIDPMILIASDYELARDYMLAHNEDTKFETLILTGDSKIAKLKALVKNDCANGLFAKYCMVGNHVIPKDNAMVLWHWMKKEEIRFRGKHAIKFTMDPIEGCEGLMEVAQDFYTLLNNINDEFGTLEHFGSTRQCFRMIMRDKLNIISDFDTELGEQKRDEVTKALLSDNYEQEDFGDDLDSLMQKLKVVFDEKSKCPTLWDKLYRLEESRITLVCHNRQATSWKEHLESLGYDNMRLIPYKDFKQEVSSSNAYDTYYFGFLPSFNQVSWLNSLVLDREVDLRIVLFPPEISILKIQLRKIRKWENGNSGPKDLALFPDVTLEMPVKEATDDIISRFEDNYQESASGQDFSFSEARFHTSYTVEVIDNNEIVKIVNSPSKVLRVEEEGIELVPVTELEEGDKVMLYCNRSRESLYEILSEESEKFARVNSFSNLWKRKLKEYVGYRLSDAEDNLTDFPDVNVDTVRLHKISVSSGINQDYVYGQWILHPEAVRFPQKSRLDRLLRFLRDEGMLGPEEVENIRSARSFFTGVMISLGQNLSSEVQSIILEHEGSIEEYVTRIVCENSNEYPVLSRFDVSAIVSIVRHNYEECTFIKLGEKVDDNDEE